MPVDGAVTRELRAGQPREGRQEVHRCDQFVGDLAGGDVSRPTHDARYTLATFKRRRFPLTQWPR